jgi:TM2 domain-containing membrane protein YozV
MGDHVMFLFSLFFISASSDDCFSLPDWLYNCTIPKDAINEDTNTFLVSCDATGIVQLTCDPLIDCNGPYRTFSIPCAPTTGKKIGTALVLSIFLGWLGADRFYLGYPTLGIFKLFTAGFFGLGWYLDVFLIAVRITTPSGGIPYMFEPGANFQVRLPVTPFN